jgi:hypothetical protein
VAAFGRLGGHCRRGALRWPVDGGKHSRARTNDRGNQPPYDPRTLWRPGRRQRRGGDASSTPAERAPAPWLRSDCRRHRTPSTP